MNHNADNSHWQPFYTMGAYVSNTSPVHSTEISPAINMNISGSIGTTTIAQNQSDGSAFTHGVIPTLPLDRHQQPNLSHPTGSQCASMCSLQRAPRQRVFNEYEEFYLLIKILFRCLARQCTLGSGCNTSPNNSRRGDHKLILRAKSIVAECTRRNRLGDPDFLLLPQAVENRLRPIVGEKYWGLARSYMHRFLQKYSVQAMPTELSPSWA